MGISYQPASITYEHNTVRYEFNTRDKDGNKVMDKLSYEETWRLLNEISEQHKNQNVFFQLSGDAVEAFSRDFLAHTQEWKEKAMEGMEEKAALFQQYLEPAVKRRIIIPNCDTQKELRAGLDGAEEWLEDAAYFVIRNNLIPHKVENLTEDERKELIYTGLEQAKYLAQRMDQGKASVFMKAMNTIAKYGLNGKMAEDGKMTYDIRWYGLYDDPAKVMKERSPKDYAVYKEIAEREQKTYSPTFETAADRFAMKWWDSVGSKEKAEWKKKVNDTKIESNYRNTDKSDIGLFMNSILGQSTVLNRDYLMDNLQKFAKFVSSSSEK